MNKIKFFFLFFFLGSANLFSQITAGEVSSNVYFKDLNSDASFIFTCNWIYCSEYAVDVNNDNIIDFKFYSRMSSSPGSSSHKLTVKAFNKNKIMLSDSFAIALNFGDVINQYANWSDEADSLILDMSYSSLMGNSHIGPWSIVNEGYLPIQLNLNNELLFGYIHLLNSHSTLNKVMDFGIQVTNKEPFVYPNPFIEKIQFYNFTNKECTFELYDSNAKQVVKKDVLNYSLIDAENLQSGFYVYNVKENGKIISKGKLIKK